MTSDLSDLILSLTPEDGSSIGNGAMLALLRDHVPTLTDEAYEAARDALIDDGTLGRGKGRGGSVYRADVVDLELTAPVAKEPKPATSTRKKASRRSDEPTEVLSYRYGETRVNNPEVGMVHADTDPDGEKTRWQYDPHLDPVLNFDSARGAIETLIDDALASDDPVRMKDALTELKRLQAPYLNWTGKAEKTSFEVDTVSLHVHERVDPATILANAAKRLKGQDAATQWRQPDLFAAPFENLPLRQALDFYHHEKGWSNRLVAGDSLLVMNSLLTKESMGGKVQMIYIDPPYGIKYGSNFQPFTNKRDVKDRSDADLTQEPEMIKAFRDTWELGIHSYLTYLRDRLMLARELLTESGSVFVQISDENVHHVRETMDEILGSENFVSIITFVKSTAQTTQLLSSNTDYIVWYAKNKAQTKYRQPYQIKEIGGVGASNYGFLEDEFGRSQTLTKKQKAGLDPIPAGLRPFSSGDMTSQRPPGSFPVDLFGMTLLPGKTYWKTSEVGINRLHRSGRILQKASRISYKRYLDDFLGFPLTSTWTDTASSFSERAYVVQTTEKVIERCLIMCTDTGDLVLDPTCGSGTTAFVAEKWGRRWITCDTSRVAITLAKQRLMTASFDYYALRYPHEGLKGGFDYETVPHVTLKSIANNPDIDTIYDEDHPSIAAALANLNAALTSAPPRPSSPRKAIARASRSPSATATCWKNGRCPLTSPPTGPKRPRPRSRPSTRPDRPCSAAWTSPLPITPIRKRSTTSPASIRTSCASPARSASRPCPRLPSCHWTRACQRKRPTAPSPALAKLRANRSGVMSC